MRNAGYPYREKKGTREDGKPHKPSKRRDLQPLLDGIFHGREDGAFQHEMDEQCPDARQKEDPEDEGQLEKEKRTVLKIEKNLAFARNGKEEGVGFICHLK